MSHRSLPDWVLGLFIAFGLLAIGVVIAIAHEGIRPLWLFLVVMGATGLIVGFAAKLLHAAIRRRR